MRLRWPARSSTALIVMLAVAGDTGCRVPKTVYGPTSGNIGTAPSGHPAAVYEISLGPDKGGQVQIWSEGVADAGRHTLESARQDRVLQTLLVGIIARNDGRTPLLIEPSDVRLILDDLPELRPRDTPPVSVQPGNSTEVLLRFRLPKQMAARGPDHYVVEWAVHFGSESYRQTTAFSRQRERGFTPDPLDVSGPIDRPYFGERESPPPIGVPVGEDPPP